MILALLVASNLLSKLALGTTSQRGTFEALLIDLHQILGHAGSNAIAKLLSIVNRLRLSSLLVLEEFRTYEIYYLIKAHRIISRELGNKVPVIRLL